MSNASNSEIEYGSMCDKIEAMNALYSAGNPSRITFKCSCSETGYLIEINESIIAFMQSKYSKIDLVPFEVFLSFVFN